MRIRPIAKWYDADPKSAKCDCWIANEGRRSDAWRVAKAAGWVSRGRKHICPDCAKANAAPKSPKT